MVDQCAGGVHCVQNICFVLVLFPFVLFCYFSFFVFRLSSFVFFFSFLFFWFVLVTTATELGHPIQSVLVKPISQSSNRSIDRVFLTHKRWRYLVQFLGRFGEDGCFTVSRVNIICWRELARFRQAHKSPCGPKHWDVLSPFALLLCEGEARGAKQPTK